eukprot:5744888-Amphidinium_carterae.1
MAFCWRSFREIPSSFPFKRVQIERIGLPLGNSRPFASEFIKIATWFCRNCQASRTDFAAPPQESGRY